MERFGDSLKESPPRNSFLCGPILSLALISSILLDTQISLATTDSPNKSLDRIVAEQLAKRLKDIPEDELITLLEELMVASRQPPPLTEPQVCDPVLPFVPSDTEPILDSSPVPPSVNNSKEGDRQKQSSVTTSQLEKEPVKEEPLLSVPSVEVTKEDVEVSRDVKDETAGLFRQFLQQNSAELHTEDGDESHDVAADSASSSGPPAFLLDELNLGGGFFLVVLFVATVFYGILQIRRRFGGAKSDDAVKEERSGGALPRGDTGFPLSPFPLASRAVKRGEGGILWRRESMADIDEENMDGEQQREQEKGKPLMEGGKWEGGGNFDDLRGQRGGPKDNSKPPSRSYVKAARFQQSAPLEFADYPSAQQTAKIRESHFKQKSVPEDPWHAGGPRSVAVEPQRLSTKEASEGGSGRVEERRGHFREAGSPRIGPSRRDWFEHRGALWVRGADGVFSPVMGGRERQSQTVQK